jgi:hypothetical protein
LTSIFVIANSYDEFLWAMFDWKAKGKKQKKYKSMHVFCIAKLKSDLE